MLDETSDDAGDGWLYVAAAAIVAVAFAPELAHLIRNRHGAARLVGAMRDCEYCMPTRCCRQHQWEVGEFARTGDVDVRYWKRGADAASSRHPP